MQILDSLLKEMGLLWLVILYPIGLVLVWKAARSVRRVWGRSEAEAALASLPRTVVQNPRKCHRCFVAVVVGISGPTLTILVTPIFVVLNNRMVDAPLKDLWVVDAVGLVALLGLYTAFILLLYGYGAAWIIKTRRTRKT